MGFMGIQVPASGVPVLGPPGSVFGAGVASVVGVGSTSAEDMFNSAASANSLIKAEDQEKGKQRNLETHEALTHPPLPLSLLFG
jgi:hypothetical protein